MELGEIQLQSRLYPSLNLSSTFLLFGKEPASGVCLSRTPVSVWSGMRPVYKHNNEFLFFAILQAPKRGPLCAELLSAS